MSRPLESFRHLFAWLAPEQRRGEFATEPEPRESPPDYEGRDDEPGEEEAKPRSLERGTLRRFPVSAGEGGSGESAVPPGREEEPSPSRHLARRMNAYLNARAEEALALLVGELSEEMAREVAGALAETRRTVSTEIEGVREGLSSSQREFSRLGREMVRSGAALEALQAAVASLAPAVERMGDSLREELQRKEGRERQLREEAERAALNDLLATQDGLEAGMESGRELVRELAEAHRRLKDATVQRWWRAMGEATGAKRPLPEVPLADVEGWIAGIELTHRRLQDALARRRVTPIEAVGKPFDPYLHEAVAVEPCPEELEGLVLREEQRGYRTPDRVLRLARVVVGRAQPARTPPRRRRQHPAPEEQPAGNHESPAGGGSGHAGQLEDEVE